MKEIISLAVWFGMIYAFFYFASRGWSKGE